MWFWYPVAAHEELDDPRQLSEVMRPELLWCHMFNMAAVSHVQYGCCCQCDLRMTSDRQLEEHVLISPRISSRECHG